MIFSSKIINKITKKKIDEVENDFDYWQTRSYKERLHTLELIRQEYSSWKNDSQQGFQRVYSIIKQK